MLIILYFFKILSLEFLKYCVQTSLLEYAPKQYNFLCYNINKRKLNRMSFLLAKAYVVFIAQVLYYTCILILFQAALVKKFLRSFRHQLVRSYGTLRNEPDNSEHDVSLFTSFMLFCEMLSVCLNSRLVPRFPSCITLFCDYVM